MSAPQPPSFDPATDSAEQANPEVGGAPNHPGDQRPRLYRREALEYRAGAQHEAHLLNLSPAWTRRTYGMVVAMCSLSLLFTSVAQLHEYASGLALIQTEGRTDVIARSSGTIETLSVRPGQRVAAGQILGRLYSRGEAAELMRIDREIELQLVNLLRNLESVEARSALTTLRAQRERALALVAERAVVAPRAGVIRDVRAFPGQQVEPGEFILSLVEESAETRVTAMLPGHYRPLLRPGMQMRLEIEGYPYAYVMTTIETLSDEVVSPAEARRFLRQPIAGVVTTTIPVILVEARLPNRTFSVDGRHLRFYDGMRAHAEVAVRTESILLTLVPGLRALWGGSRPDRSSDEQ